MKFAHIADSHLGGWRQPELSELNLQAFQKATEICIEEKVDFILFTGDLFDSAFPSIEILKQTFSEFKKIKQAGIKSYIIAGSHDYSVSGKTFLDVLESADFCKIARFEENEQQITLLPINHESYYIYGYPGKKSGLEIEDLKKIKIKEQAGNFKILMLHTTITEIPEMQGLPIETIQLSSLPQADYYALGHIHIDFEQEINGKPAIYGGPTFPNNFKELEELKHGSFYIIEITGYTKITKKEIKLKDVELVEIELNNALTGTQQILSELEKRELADKIILLKIFGILKQGKTSDINFQEVEDYVKNSGAYSFLKNTSKLEIEKTELQIELNPKEMEKVEEILIKKYENENPSDFNELIFPLIEALNKEKQEDEKSAVFEQRLFSDLSKVLGVELT